MVKNSSTLVATKNCAKNVHAGIAHSGIHDLKNTVNQSSISVFQLESWWTCKMAII
jgi:hypothetical protein